MELVSATGNPGDSGNVGNTADTTVQIVDQGIDSTPPPPQDTLEATVAINNLDPGETFILRLTTRLECIAGEDPTGNIDAAIEAGRVVSPTPDDINVGRQVVPFMVKGLVVPPAPATFTIVLGACPAPGSATVPVTITIDPPGSAVVTITAPGGPYVVNTGGVTVLDLPPGDYTAVGVPAPGFSLTVTTIAFTVQECPPVPATVEVSVGACPPTSSATRPVTVTIDPANAADVEISGPNGFNEVVTGSGSTGNLAPSTYTYTATANPGFELTGPTDGTFTVGSCVIELPQTGANIAGLVGVGLAFLSVGFGMTRLSRRPTLIG